MWIPLYDITQILVELQTELEEAALDAAGHLGMTRAGAELLLTDPTNPAADVAARALGRAPSPALRLAALHAVATLAGAERAGGAAQHGAVGAGGGGRLGPSSGGPPAGARDAVAASPAAEEALRREIFRGATGAAGSPTPAQAFLELLEQPFIEVRVAAYR